MSLAGKSLEQIVNFISGFFSTAPAVFIMLIRLYRLKSKWTNYSKSQVFPSISMQVLTTHGSGFNSFLPSRFTNSTRAPLLFFSNVTNLRSISIAHTTVKEPQGSPVFSLLTPNYFIFVNGPRGVVFAYVMRWDAMREENGNRNPAVSEM
jgi:hypothetical protein